MTKAHSSSGITTESVTFHVRGEVTYHLTHPLHGQFENPIRISIPYTHLTRALESFHVRDGRKGVRPPTVKFPAPCSRGTLWKQVLRMASRREDDVRLDGLQHGAKSTTGKVMALGQMKNGLIPIVLRTEKDGINVCAIDSTIPPPFSVTNVKKEDVWDIVPRQRVMVDVEIYLDERECDVKKENGTTGDGVDGNEESNSDDKKLHIYYSVYTGRIPAFDFIYSLYYPRSNTASPKRRSDTDKQVCDDEKGLNFDVKPVRLPGGKNCQDDVPFVMTESGLRMEEDFGVDIKDGAVGKGDNAVRTNKHSGLPLGCSIVIQSPPGREPGVGLSRGTKINVIVDGAREGARFATTLNRYSRELYLDGPRESDDEGDGRRLRRNPDGDSSDSTVWNSDSENGRKDASEDEVFDLFSRDEFATETKPVHYYPFKEKGLMTYQFELRCDIRPGDSVRHELDKSLVDVRMCHYAFHEAEDINKQVDPKNRMLLSTWPMVQIQNLNCEQLEHGRLVIHLDDDGDTNEKAASSYGAWFVPTRRELFSSVSGLGEARVALKVKSFDRSRVCAVEECDEKIKVECERAIYVYVKNREVDRDVSFMLELRSRGESHKDTTARKYKDWADAVRGRNDDGSEAPVVHVRGTQSTTVRSIMVQMKAEERGVVVIRETISRMRSRMGAKMILGQKETMSKTQNRKKIERLLRTFSPPAITEDEKQEKERRHNAIAEEIRLKREWRKCKRIAKSLKSKRTVIERQVKNECREVAFNEITQEHVEVSQMLVEVMCSKGVDVLREEEERVAKQFAVIERRMLKHTEAV